MALKNQSECAVHECNGPCSEGANLCDQHLVPGMVIKHGNSTVVVTAWYTERANQAGVIVLNDYALGDLFGGAAGFKAKLEQQGFSKVRNLRTPEEIEAAKVLVAKAPGNWSGPWLTEYPWEIGARDEG
jgi:hypothetical protein